MVEESVVTDAEILCYGAVVTAHVLHEVSLQHVFIGNNTVVKNSKLVTKIVGLDLF